MERTVLRPLGDQDIYQRFEQPTGAFDKTEADATKAFWESGVRQTPSFDPCRNACGRFEGCALPRTTYFWFNGSMYQKATAKLCRRFLPQPAVLLH